MGVQLPFSVTKGDTKTYQELCKEAKEAIQSTAADWIPRFCMALKRQHPLMASAEIRKKVVNDWSSVWKANTMNTYWPDWMKNPAAVEAGRIAKIASDEAKKEKKAKGQINSTFSEQDTKQQEQEQQERTLTPKEQERIRAIQKFDTLADNICGNAMVFTELLTGYKEDEIGKLDNFKLLSETKQYRTDLTMKLSELQIGIIYRDCRRAAIILNDFLKRVDDELTSRQRKKVLTSE